MNNNRVVYINPISSNLLELLSKQLYKQFGATELKDVAYTVFNCIKDNTIKIAREAEDNETALFPYEELSQNLKVNKPTYCSFISFFLADIENFKVYYNSLPEGYKIALQYIVENGSIELNHLKKLSGDSNFAKYVEVSWRTTFVIDDRMFFLERSPYYYKDIIRLNDNYKAFIYKALCNAKELPDGVEDLPSEFKSFSNGSAFLDATDIIYEAYKQKWLKLDEKGKIGATEMKRAIKLTGLTDFFPAEHKKILFTTPTAIAIAIYVNQLKYVKTHNPAFNVKLACDALHLTAGSFILSNLLPFIGGIKRAELWRYEEMFSSYILRYFNLIANTKGWISFEDTYKSMKFFNGGLSYNIPIGNNYFFSRCGIYEKNNYESIIEENSRLLLDIPLLKLIACGLSVFGVVDIAYSQIDPKEEIPYAFIRYFRLTEFGEYVFGKKDSYKFDVQQKKEPKFDIDNERLIIRSISDNNPFTSFINDIAVGIGANRFQVSSKTMLSSCSSQKDLDEKIGLFKRLVCDDLPQNWQDFFNELRQRIKPLKSASNYHIFEIDKNNKPLIELISNDAEIRKLIIKAEGYRILVDTSKYDSFKKLMKSKGYII